MPVLRSTPLPMDIAGLKGKVDIYWYRGQICARRWPRPYTGTPSEARQASYTTFGEVAKLVLQNGDTAITAAVVASTGAPWTWRDAWTSAQYGHVIRW